MSNPKKVILSLVLAAGLLTIAVFGTWHRVLGQTASPQTSLPRFVNVKHGDIFSGEVLVHISLPKTMNAGENGPNLFVDRRWAGQMYGEATVGQRMDKNSYLASASLPTNTFANGMHTLDIDDGTQNGGSLREGKVFDRRRVRFANTVSLFSNDGTNINPALAGKAKKTGDLPSQAVVCAVITPAQPWRVDICKDDEKTVIRAYRGAGRRVNVVWNGRDVAGRSVANGSYFLVIRPLKTGQPMTSLINVSRS